MQCVGIEFFWMLQDYFSKVGFSHQALGIAFPILVVSSEYRDNQTIRNLICWEDALIAEFRWCECKDSMIKLERMFL